ncbi:MAG: TIR domain-containing protein [Christensenellaceae bacterium]|nr:TIR domain-containing protein [Christensenellaceae bacterium]
MSIQQAQRDVNQLDSEINAIEKKIAEHDKKAADAELKIGSVQRSINKNTSASTLSSKQRQIQGYQNDKERALKSKMDEQKKLLSKQTRRREAYLRLQKEQAADVAKERKAQEQTQKSIISVYEQRLSDMSKQLEERLATHKASVNAGYAGSTGGEEFDVFVSHATEDKESFVDEFVRILRDEHHLKVWYDNDVIKWGDSIRAKINEGLRNSKFGVVVLSPDFIRKYWTQYELAGLFQREADGGKVILPIWHHLSVQEVKAFDYALADRSALNTAFLAPAEIADFLVAMLEPSSSEGKPSAVLEPDDEDADQFDAAPDPMDEDIISKLLD